MYEFLSTLVAFAFLFGIVCIAYKLLKPVHMAEVERAKTQSEMHKAITKYLNSCVIEQGSDSDV